MSNRFRFRKLFRKLLPSWLSTLEGQLVGYSLGYLCDAFAERARQSALARFPTNAPAGAFLYLGRDRKVVRGIDEANASYADRLIGWLDAHRNRGNAFALCAQIRAYCNANVRVRTIDQRGNWYTVDRDGSRSYSREADRPYQRVVSGGFASLVQEGAWNWDNGPSSNWARFWVIIYPEYVSAGETPEVPYTGVYTPWSPQSWQEHVWGDDTIGTTATRGEVAAVRSVIRFWRPAGTRCEWIIVCYDDDIFSPEALTGNPAGEYGPWGDQSGNPSEPARFEGARYWDGTGSDRAIS